MPLSFALTESEKAFLGDQAKRSIESRLFNLPDSGPEQPEDQASVLCRDLGSFVTLTIGGMLRGCIGTIVGREPLFLNVWSMARAAAFDDPRFPALIPKEWPLVAMEISVLDAPTPCPDPSLIEIGRDGLILQYNGRSGVFLPQVPVEQGWDREEYLDHLCLKAGVPIGSWRKPSVRLFWYQALVFPVAKDIA
ncbi:MAG: AmmeMemoRadiSam system protein A [Desulfovibrio sp.]|nr:AmmeMemoRadiSam system protein A [Desulfovibrio sp.]